MVTLFVAGGCGDDDENGPEPPTITSLNPNSGLVGSTTVITGLNFGTDPSVTTVNFGTTSANINSITATLINVTVPDGLSAGEIAVTVTVDGRTSNQGTFEITEIPVPTITSINPTEGLSGASITITGTNFSDEDAENQVSFGDEEATIISASTTEIVAEVPANLQAGEVSVSVTVNQRTSNLVTFTILVPEITGVSPGIGPIGTGIIITGTNFSTVQGENVVTFGDVEASITSFSATEIRTTVPVGISAGALLVRVTVNGVASNALQFTVEGPTITSINPTAGPVGSEVVISGTNFSSTSSENTVSFGNEQANIISATPNAITVEVPTSLALGTADVIVTVNGLIAAGAITFEVIVPVSPLYWIEQATGGMYEIIRGTIDNDGNAEAMVEHSSSDLIRTIAVDSETDNVYWTEDIADLSTFEGFSTIYSNTGSIYATGQFSFVFISSLAIDTQNNHIYWLEGDDFSFSQIWRSDLDGNNREQLFSSESFAILSSLELDVNNGKMYFIENVDDPVTNINSRVYQADLNGPSISILYEERNDLPPGSDVIGFVDLAVNNSSIYIAGTQQPGSVSQLLMGSVEGSGTTGLSVVYESLPGNTSNPMPQILGLTVDKEFEYLYWINYGESGGATNSADGSIFRGPIDSSIDPELLFDNLELPNQSNPVKNGRSRGNSREVSFGFTF